MTIWRLTPTDVESPQWKASTLKKSILVKAETESRARQIATMHTGIATPHVLGQQIPSPPWKNPELVTAVEIKSFTEDGFDIDETVFETIN